MTPKDVSSGKYTGEKFFELLPKREDIPREFDYTKPDKSKWVEITETWFFKGLPSNTEFKPRDGIDGHLALKHLRYVLSSFQPKHEHKTEGVAYLMSLWFEDVIIPNDEGN